MRIELSTYEEDYDRRHATILEDHTAYYGKQRLEIEINGEKAILDVEDLLAAVQAIKAIAPRE